jgi:hypothetical protein
VLVTFVVLYDALHHEDGTSLVGLLLQLLHDDKKTVVLVPEIIIIFHQAVVSRHALLL